MPRAVLVTPIRPGLVGSGLAHRAAAWQRALGAVAEVHTVVVPVADPGAASAVSPRNTLTVRLPDTGERVVGAVKAMTDAATREAMAAYDVDLPQVAAAPPWLGARVAREHLAGVPPFDVVVCFRAYLAPFVAGMRAVAPALAAARLIVDLDDDDAAFHASRGQHAAAAACDRLVNRIADDGAVQVAAGRHQFEGVGVLPNCVDLPPLGGPPELPLAGDARVLFVGNFTYLPNVEAADWYLREVHPLVRERRPDARLRLVGRGSERWAGAEGVEAGGVVPDLAPEYSAATVTIAPLQVGSGTRIKVLEAWAHARPLVCTTVGVDGIEVRAGVHADAADLPAEFALAVTNLLDDPARAAALGMAGRRHVEALYGSAAFDRRVAALVRPDSA